jgi:hypothetical protein
MLCKGTALPQRHVHARKQKSGTTEHPKANSYGCEKIGPSDSQLVCRQQARPEGTLDEVPAPALHATAVLFSASRALLSEICSRCWKMSARSLETEAAVTATTGPAMAAAWSLLVLVLVCALHAVALRRLRISALRAADAARATRSPQPQPQSPATDETKSTLRETERAAASSPPREPRRFSAKTAALKRIAPASVQANAPSRSFLVF